MQIIIMYTDLGGVIIRTSNKVRPVTTSEVINTIHTFKMGIQSKIWIWRAQIPDLKRQTKK